MSRNSAWTVFYLCASLALAAGGFASLRLVSGALVKHKDRAPRAAEYMPGRRLLEITSFGFEKAMADALWIQSIQYFNEETKKPRQGAALKGPLLMPQLEAMVHLDPHFHGAYYIGSLFLRIFRRHEETLRFLEFGEKKNPDMAMYPFEHGLTLHLEMRERDRALEVFKRALVCPDVSPAQAVFIQSLLTNKGEIDAMISLFVEQHSKARSKAIKEDWENRIRAVFASISLQAIRNEVRNFTPVMKPMPEAIPGLDSLKRLKLEFRGFLRGFAVYSTATFRAGPVSGFRDHVFYDPSADTVFSLFLVRSVDRANRDRIAAAVAAYSQKRGVPPPEGVEGIRAILDERLLMRDPAHPLGGGYSLDQGRGAVSNEGWEAELARFPD